VDILKFGFLPIIVLYVAYPLQGTFGKVALQSGPFTTYVALVLLFTGSFMVAMHYLTQKTKIILKRWDILLLLQGAFFGLYIRYLACLWSLQYLTVGKVYFLFLLAPFFSALFSKLCGTETLSYKKLLSLCIGILGFIPVIVFGSASEDAFKSFYALNLPEIVLIIGVACYAYNWVIIKRLLVEGQHSLWTINGITMMGASLATIITAFFYDGWYTGVSPIVQLQPFLVYAFIVASVGAFCFTLHSILLKKFSATLVAFFCLIEPFVASVYGYLFIGEPLSLIQVPALGVVSIGLYIFYQDELQTN
jgi:drug/metabolite transporter (DMT)-like permease